MISIKKVFGIFMLALLMLVMPYKVTSASVETNIKRIEEKANTIEISVDKINYEIKSFSISLKIKGDVTLDTLTWSDTLSDQSIKKNYKYNASENIIDIYITSKKNLVEYSNLKVASITVKGDGDTNYSIDSNGKFKFIYSDKNKSAEMNNLKSNNSDEFRFIKMNNIPDNDNSSEKEEDKSDGESNSTNTENNGTNNENIANNSGNKQDKDNSSNKTEEVAKNDGSNNLASSESGATNSDNNQSKDNSSGGSEDKSVAENNQSKEENLLSNQSKAKGFLWGSILVIVIILSAGIALIYNYKRKKS
ncbi:hypothetical protein NSA50_09580 [Clostridium sp. DSM 100503]|uniref:hypothetical protein n=1 Tax=Clostridium sp. DSM 100503 TaxID=2963282 RepID=UPI00214A102E|nr:hypothetical protein [Clostridium sp. DSM 100503]MCR1951299.1 hypothetical protein [Clostridium sp. DSM 100503]